jgi:hypothetical protein
MYYCGGPYKEQAGTVPTYTHPKYATVGSASSAHLPIRLEFAGRLLLRAVQSRDIFGAGVRVLGMFLPI